MSEMPLYSDVRYALEYTDLTNRFTYYNLHQTNECLDMIYTRTSLYVVSFHRMGYIVEVLARWQAEL